ncbi:MAG TPA: exonuclease domain-containing protein [Actinotalea sp.]|nr:exonuclease domain-containing protein [Actinotalea sp.]
MRWIDGALMGFDTETTGVDVGTDRVVTAALVRRAGSAAPGTPSLSTVTWLIDPGVPIPAGAAAIHGVTTAHARAHGRPAAVALEEIATGLAAALRRGEPVVAFNASYDLSLLDAELRRHRLPTLPERIGHEVRTVVDPLVLDRYLDRYRPGKRRLGDLCAHYGVTTAALHTAEVDVLATLDVLAAIAAAHPELAAMTLDEVHDLQVTAHRTWAEGFNAWRTQQGLVGAGAELDWPSRVPAVGPLWPVPA